MVVSIVISIYLLHIDIFILFLSSSLMLTIKQIDLLILKSIIRHLVSSANTFHSIFRNRHLHMILRIGRIHRIDWNLRIIRLGFSWP